MKHCLSVILLILLCLGHARAADQTFAENHVSASSTQGNTVSSYSLRLPNLTQGGNCIIVGFQYSATAGVTGSVVNDDQSNSYSLAISHSDLNQVVNLFFALNVHPGAQEITITFSGGQPDHVSALATEFYNIATANALDGSSGNNGSSTSVSAGSFTPTADGDLIYQYAVQDFSSNPMNSWSQGASPWVLLSSDLLDSSAAQYQVQTTAAPINATMGMTPSQSFNSVAIALKAGSSGSAPPAGIRVVRVQHHSVLDSSSTVRLQFPCTGNLIVLAWIGAPGHDITGVTDGNNNAYVSQGSAYGYGLSGDSQIYYVANAATSTAMSGPTITTSNTDSAGSTAVMFDVIGAAASPYDLMAEASGSQSSAGNVRAVTISPSTANGLVITTIGVDSNTINGLAAGTPGNFLSAIPTPMTGENPVDENNGWALWYNAGPGAGTFVWTTEDGAVNGWASVAVAFEKAGGSGSPGSFSGTVSPATATVNVGGSQTFTVQISSVSGFQGQVSLSCPNEPAGISCQFTSTPVQVNAGGAATSSLTVSVTSKPAAAITSLRRFRPELTFRLATWQVIAEIVAVFLVFVLHRNRVRRKLRLRFVNLAAIALLIALALRFESCGGAASSTGSGGGGTPVTVQVSVQGVSGNTTANLGSVAITVP